MIEPRSPHSDRRGYLRPDRMRRKKWSHPPIKAISPKTLRRNKIALRPPRFPGVQQAPWNEKSLSVLADRNRKRRSLRQLRDVFVGKGVQLVLIGLQQTGSENIIEHFPTVLGQVFGLFFRIEVFLLGNGRL